MSKFKDRNFVLRMCITIMFFIIILKLVDLQIVHGKEYAEQSNHSISGSRIAMAPRGNIVDRNGIKIAANRMGFTVMITQTKMSNDELNTMILNLVNILEKNNNSYSKNLGTYLMFNPIEYAPNRSMKNVEGWLKDTVAQKASDLDLLTSPTSVFEYLRNTKYKISSKYTDADAYKIMCIRYEMQIGGFSASNALCIAKDVSDVTVAQIEEKNDQFPGVTTDIQPVREYINAQPEAQVIGYVRGITAEQYATLKDKGYQINDIVGQSGIESIAEPYLRGINGIKSILTDAKGNLTQENEVTALIPGDDVYLTIDTNLQKVAMNSLKANIDKIKKAADYKSNFGDASAGAVVAMDVHTGEVLAMASYPSYDPSIYNSAVTNIDAQKAIAALNDPNSETKPLINRAISAAYAPGSTFKPITAIAGLEENVITPQSIIKDTGVVNIGGRNFYSLEYRQGLGVLGDLNLERALATSNNIFFHVLGFKTGIDNIDKWAEYFGLGKKTGIDIPGESAGVLASQTYKMKVFNDEWRPADTAQAAIGQLYNSFTPLQLANYVSAIANGGKLFTPFLIKKIVKSDGTLVKETQPQYKSIPVKQSTLDAVKKGMIAVTNASDGTAATIFDGLPFKVAGKTGTAETGAESTHSSNALFVCYAPADNPQIAVAVVVERGAWGANTAPIARDVLEAYFNTKSTP